MALRGGDPFGTDSPGAAARQLRLALGALLGSVALWVVAVVVYWRVDGTGWIPGWGILVVLVVGAAVETCVVFAFVRSLVEYGTWVSNRVDWPGS